MLNFNTLEEALNDIKSQPGYLPASLNRAETVGSETSQGVITTCSLYTFRQEITGVNKNKVREATVVQLMDEITEEVISASVSYEILSETPEGHSKVVSSFSSPDEFYPWVFSIWGHMPRDGAGLDKFRFDGSPAQVGDDDADLYFKKSIMNILAYEIGFQNICACWARMNEGDTCDVFVDIPGAWVGQPGVEWVQFAQFGEDITMFDTNAKGTYYPPTQSPAVSWVPAGARIRVELYKKVNDDPEYLLTAGQTEATNPEKRGPFLDLDILCQRKR